MSAFPLMLRGEAIDALIVGGGAVATRKARALLEAGARVRVIAPRIDDSLRALARASRRLVLVERAYAAGDVGDATLVIAATGDRAVNALVAEEAAREARLVNVADDPQSGNCITVATHRAGDLVIGVSAGGVPGAAARVRDAIGARFDGRYAAAVEALSGLRQGMLARGDRDGWRRAAGALVSDDFCARVEDGTLVEETARWR